MNRTHFVMGTGAAVLANTATARAGQLVLGGATAWGVPTRAWVQQPALIRQQCQEWCWAASCAMIFTTLGHPIDQQTIVDRVFGYPACRASGPTTTLLGVLNDTWTDTNGAQFTSQVVAAYDYFSGIHAIDNAVIVNELGADFPLLYCNTHHAMVVVAADFMNTPQGPSRVDAVTVMDPWPYYPGVHNLSPAEMIPAHMHGQMTFLATVRLT